MSRNTPLIGYPKLREVIGVAISNGEDLHARDITGVLGQNDNDAELLIEELRDWGMTYERSYVVGQDGDPFDFDARTMIRERSLWSLITRLEDWLPRNIMGSNFSLPPPASSPVPDSSLDALRHAAAHRILAKYPEKFRTETSPEGQPVLVPSGTKRGLFGLFQSELPTTLGWGWKTFERIAAASHPDVAKYFDCVSIRWPAANE